MSAFHRILLAAIILCLLPLHAALAETRVMVASDLHYLAQELYADSPFFLRVMRNADGKIPQYGEALMEGLLRQAILEQPDALLLTGDLTFNGERASHEALAAWLDRFEAAGIPVWVQPGNHDINIPSPVGFTASGWYTVPAVDEEAFQDIYRHFMLESAEGANFSYAVPVSDQLWLAVTDVAYYKEQAQTFGVYTAGHSRWLRQVLEEAKAQGVEVITSSHQNLIAHTSFSRDSYLMLGSESMAALAREYGLRLHLSGHLHIQHIAVDGQLYDAATGAFCLWPHRYAIVTLAEDGTLSYEARQLSDSLLPEGLAESSRDWFFSLTKERSAASLAAYSLSEEAVELMSDYAARFNLAYFAGVYRNGDLRWTEDPAYTLWAALEGEGFSGYLQLVQHEYNEENLRLQLERR